MAITVFKTDGTMTSIPPSPVTCRQAIFDQRLHDGNPDFHVTCDGVCVDDEPAVSYDGKKLMMRTVFVSNSAKNEQRKEFDMMRYDSKRNTPFGTEYNQVACRNELRDVIRQDQDDRIKGRLLKEPGFFRRLTPDESERQRRDGKLKLEKIEIDSLLQRVHLKNQFTLDAIEEKYQTWLRVIKVENRENFYCFVTQKVSDLQQTIFEREKNYFHLIRQQYELIEANQDLPRLAEAYTQKIETGLENHLAWLQFIMNDFQNIVQEKIRSYEDK